MIDWEKIREECIRSGEIIKLSKEEVLPLPPWFHETKLGLSKGAIRQYRDESPSNSLHLHEFPDYFLVHVDTFNPEIHPVAHGLVDTPGMALFILGASLAIFFAAKAIKQMSLLPPDSEKIDI